MASWGLFFSALWNKLLPQPVQNRGYTADTQSHNFLYNNCHPAIEEKKKKKNLAFFR